MGGEPEVSIRDDRGRETVNTEYSLNKDICGFDCRDVQGNWDEVCETSEAI